MKRAEHFDAFKAAIPSPVGAHDTFVPLVDGKILHASYAVLHDLGTDAAPDDERLTAPQRAVSKVTWRYVVKSVGETPFAARSVDSAIATSLIGKVLTVSGRKCDPLRMDETGQVKEDTATSPSLYYVESDYLLRTQPA